MKKVSGTLKLDQAQFRELEAFAKFGSDLDAATKLVIDRGRRNQEILKQGQFQPSPVGDQVAMIYGSINGIMDKVPVDRVKEFESEFLTLMRATKPEYLSTLAAGKLEKEITEWIMAEGKGLAAKYA